MPRRVYDLNAARTDLNFVIIFKPPVCDVRYGFRMHKDGGLQFLFQYRRCRKMVRMRMCIDYEFQRKFIFVKYFLYSSTKLICGSIIRQFPSELIIYE